MMIDRVVGKVEMIIHREAEVVMIVSIVIATVKENIIARRRGVTGEVGATVAVEVMMTLLL